MKNIPRKKCLGITTARIALLAAVLTAIPGLAQESKEKKEGETSPAPKEAATPEKTTDSSQSPVLMPEVVVTATRTEEGTQNIPQSVTVVTREQIERQQAQTPNQMLREQPGIWSVQVASQGSPIVRGQIGNRVLYLWDGIPINNGALFGGPNGYFNQFPIGSVGRMEVIRGPGSLQYGSGAIGGVINILTKRPDEFTTGLKYGGEAYARYGTVNEEATETADFFVTDKEVSLSGGLSSQNVGDYRAPDVGVQRSTGFDALGGNASLAFRPLTNHVLRLTEVYNDRENVGYYGQSKLNPSGIPRVFSPYERRSLTKMDYEMKDLGPISDEMKLYTYYQNFDQVRERRVETIAGGTDTFNNTKTRTLQDVIGGGIQNTTPWNTSWGDHKFTYGLDYRTEDLGTDVSLLKTTTPPGTTATSIPFGKTPNGSYDVFDLFTMAELHPADRWTVSTGGRYERTGLHSKPVPSDVIPNAGYTLDDLKLDKTWDSGTWSVGSVYGITRKWDMVANVASGFRTPTFSDVLSTGTPVYSTKIASVPSPNVEPEQSITYELGPKFHTERWNMSLTAFWTAMTDVVRQTTNGVVVIPGQGTFAKQQASNAGEGYVRGVELAVAYKPHPDWTLFGNGAYTQSWDTRFHEHYRFTPPLNGTLGLRFEAPSGLWWAEIAEQLVDTLNEHAPGDMQDSGFSTDPGYGSPDSVLNPPLNSNYEIQGYALTNLRGGVRVWHDDRQRRLDLTLDLNNVFNQYYREAYAQQELAAPGFNAIFGARMKF